MKIASSQVNLSSASTHLLVENRSIQAQLARSSRNTPSVTANTASQPSSIVKLSGTDGVNPVTNQAFDPKLELIKSIIEYILGHKVQSMGGGGGANGGGSATAATPASEAATQSPPSTEAAVQSPSGSSSLTIQSQYTRIEASTLNFSAQGNVTTQDGQSIQFSVQLSMQSMSQTQYSETLELKTGNAVKDPLVVNLDGLGASLSSTRFSFDLMGDGTQSKIPLLASGNGFLALDGNKNGKIDSGNELFGPASGNGFNDLARLDLDHNGWIDENDPAFTQLSIWLKNDATQEGPQLSLKQAGIGAIALSNSQSAYQMNANDGSSLGNISHSGVYLNEANGSAGVIQNVNLSV